MKTKTVESVDVICASEELTIPETGWRGDAETSEYQGLPEEQTPAARTKAVDPMIDAKTVVLAMTVLSSCVGCFTSDDADTAEYRAAHASVAQGPDSREYVLCDTGVDMTQYAVPTDPTQKRRLLQRAGRGSQWTDFVVEQRFGRSSAESGTDKLSNLHVVDIDTDGDRDMLFCGPLEGAEGPSVAIFLNDGDSLHPVFHDWGRVCRLALDTAGALRELDLLRQPCCDGMRALYSRYYLSYEHGGFKAIRTTSEVFTVRGDGKELTRRGGTIYSTRPARRLDQTGPEPMRWDPRYEHGGSVAADRSAVR